MSLNNELNRRDMLKRTLAAGTGMMFATASLGELQAANTDLVERPNVLFIAIDDLRPGLGCYGNPHIQTPNIDHFAESATLFERAYCQQAVCGPSRTSMLTGLRPDTTGVTRNPVSFRETRPETITMPQFFKNSGYHTVSLGKVFHQTKDLREEDTFSWSVPAWEPKADQWLLPGNQQMIREQRKAFFRLKQSDKWEQMPWYDQAQARFRSRKALPYEAADVADDAYADGMVANRAIKTLERFSRTDKEPFFLAVGFIRPHLPFNAPKRYWDLYDPDKLPQAPVQQPPSGSPQFATKSKELNQYAGTPKDPNQRLDPQLAKKLVHGYYASTSHVDAQVGRVLNKLEQLGLNDNTIVVIWGDHGWKLGDYGEWCKHTNYELDTRAPMLIRAPGVSKPGGKVSGLVEFVDIFPTLATLSGLTLPDDLQLDGRDITPLLKNPDAPGKGVAWSQFPKARYMGYALRTDRYRFVIWIEEKTGKIGPMELYDHQNDPRETTNVANDPAYAQVIQEMINRYQAGPKP